MADDKTFSAEDIEKAVADAIAKNNAERDEGEKGLKAKVDQLLTESKAAKEERKAAEEAAAKAAEDAAKKSGNVEDLEKSYADKIQKMADEWKAKEGSYTSSIEKLTVGQAATSMAAELAVQGSASVLERVVRDRLSVEMTDNGPSIRVLDALGKPSASTLDDLRKEIAADKALAPIIAASKGSGGGAADPNGGAAQVKTVTRDAWNDMNHADRAAHSKSGGKVVDAE